MKPSNIAAAVAAAALALAAGSAGAAIATSTVNYSKLQFKVIDLTPNDGVAAGFTLTGSDGSVTFRIWNTDEQRILDEVTKFPTGTIDPTSLSHGGRDFSVWAGATAGGASASITSAKPTDGMGLTEVRSGWTFDVAPGTALLITGTVEMTLAHDGGHRLSELGGDTNFVASASLAAAAPGSGYESYWTSYKDERHTSWYHTGAYTETFGLSLLNNGNTTRSGSLDLIATSQVYAYLNSPPPVPEPATYLMLATGLLVAGVAARRRRRS